MVFPIPSQHNESHCSWVNRMREEYDSLRSGVYSDGAMDAEAAALSPFIQSRRRPSWAQESPAVSAAAYYDEYAPVYRSLGSGSMQDLAMEEVEYEGPVYRGFGTPTEGPLEGLGAMRAQVSAFPEALDGIWLARMPPLLSRQRAFGASCSQRCH